MDLIKFGGQSIILFDMDTTKTGTLINFSVGNFRSINDVVDLSLVAMDGRVVKNAIDLGSIDIMPVVAMYGANASGKTNIITSFFLMRKIILATRNSADKLDCECFSFTAKESATKETFFEVVFALGKSNKIYRYGFEYNEKAISKEWLYRVGEDDEKRLFFRDVKKDVLKVSKTGFKEGEGISKKTLLNNWLFLQKCDQNNGRISKKIVAFFKAMVFQDVADAGRLSKEFVQNMKDKQYRTKVGELVQKVDFGISGFEVRDKDYTYNEIDSPFSGLLEVLSGGEKIPVKNDLGVFAVHNVGGKDYSLDLKKESVGTKKFITLLYPFFKAFAEGGLVVVDEIDSSIHPALLPVLIGLFNDPSVNTAHAQLIFTIQNTALLDSDALDMSQVYIIEKDGGQATHIKAAIADYKGVGEDDRVSSQYLDGRFGGVPYIR